MAVTFLRGASVSLAPVGSAKAHAMRWTLARATTPLWDGFDRVIAFHVLDAGSGALVGAIAFEDIDWAARGARLTARGTWTRDAVALATRYAFDELALERIAAEPADAETEADLKAAGFAAVGGGTWELRGPSWLDSVQRS